MRLIGAADHEEAPSTPRRQARHSWLGAVRLGVPALFHADHDLHLRAVFRLRRGGDAARGQSLWGFATAAAGILIACTSPVLGAIADATGRRKPWIAAFGSLIVIGASLLWLGRPGDPATVLPVLLAFAIGSIGVEFATVFNNTMMPLLVPREKIGSLSAPAGRWAMSAA